MSGTPSPGTSDSSSVVALGEAARHERRADLVPAGLDGHANVPEAILDGFDGLNLALVEGLRVLVAADVILEHSLSVDRDDELVTIFEPAIRIAA